MKRERIDRIFAILAVCLILILIILPYHANLNVGASAFGEYRWLARIYHVVFPQLLWVFVGGLMVAPFLGEKPVPLSKLFLVVGIVGVAGYGTIMFLPYGGYSLPSVINIRMLSYLSVENPEAFCLLGILLRVGLQPGRTKG